MGWIRDNRRRNGWAYCSRSHTPATACPIHSAVGAIPHDTTGCGAKSAQTGIGYGAKSERVERAGCVIHTHGHIG
jgi:hypothetical protein